MQIHLKDGKAIWKQEWKQIAEKRVFFRSRWEFLYACFLQYLKENGLIKDWKHEAETFWFEKIKRGTRSYLPDFKVTMNDGNVEYCEVKGYMDEKSKTKIKRMRIYYPQIKIRVIDSEWFRKNKGVYALAARYE